MEILYIKKMMEISKEINFNNFIFEDRKLDKESIAKEINEIM